MGAGKRSREGERERDKEKERGRETERLRHKWEQPPNSIIVVEYRHGQHQTACDCKKNETKCRKRLQSEVQGRF